MRRNLALLALIIAGILGIWGLQYQAKLDNGRNAFMRYGCSSCHFNRAAPSLQNVGKRYDKATLAQFISDPQAIYRERGGKVLNAGYAQMPQFKVAPADVDALVAYLRTLND